MLEGPLYRIKGVELTQDEAEQVYNELAEHFGPKTEYVEVQSWDGAAGHRVRAVEEILAEVPRYKVGDLVPVKAVDPSLYGVTRLRDEYGDELQYGTWRDLTGWDWRIVGDSIYDDGHMIARPWIDFDRLSYTVVEVSG